MTATSDGIDPRDVIAEPGPTPTRCVLHVGCGWPNPNKRHTVFRGPDWQEIRLDIDPAARPDLVASMTDMAMVETGSADAIWSSHNVEHLYPHEVPVALAEFRRVLRPDGFALVTLPDLQRVAELVAAGKLEEPAYQSPAGPIAPHDILYGLRTQLAAGNLFMAHRTGFTNRSLGQALIRAGFARVSVQREGFELWAVAWCADTAAPLPEGTRISKLAAGAL